MSFGFMFYDLWFLVLFTIGVVVFLILKRKNLSREGIMFLYRTKIGLKAIDYFGKNYKKTLKILSYLIVCTGYILMIVIIILFGKSVYDYVTQPQITELIKAPPIMILIPYFPKIFGVQEFFPDFPFIYFLIAIAVIAIVHEGCHGIFARFYKVKIKSTGFGFLGPFLAFFVEQDDKDMQKKKIFPQLTIVSAGVFANIITALVFFLIIWLFFSINYSPYGIDFASYSFSPVSAIALKNAIITNDSISVNGENLTKIIADNKNYLAGNKFFEINLAELSDVAYVNLYQNQPAIRNNLKGIITEINENKVKDIEGLRLELDKYNIGEEINVKTEFNEEIFSYDIKLGESYEEIGKPVIGVIVGSKTNLKIFSIFEVFKDYGIAYKPKSNPEFNEFLYNLFAWIIIINLLVGLINMLPVGIFDGGRFFYLTILALTKKEKIAKRAYVLATQIILFGLVILMIFWAFRRYF